MTVAELIALLQEEDPEALVVCSRDAEGNGYSLLADVAAPYNYDTGEIGFAELTPELEAQGYTEEDLLDGVPAVVLYPT